MLRKLGGGGGGGGGSTAITPTTPTPAVTAISPAKLPAGSAATTLTITGSGFVSTSAVVVGGTGEATTYVSATQFDDGGAGHAAHGWR